MSHAAPFAALTRWCAELPDAPRVELLCAESPRMTGPGDSLVIRFPFCLSEVAAEDLANLACATSELAIRVDGCATGRPPAATALLLPALVGLGMGPRLQLWHRPPDEHCAAASRPELEPGRLPASRRQLVSRLVPAPLTIREGARSPQLPQQQVIDALRAMLGGAPAPPSAHHVPGPARDLRSEGCVACGTCVRACPTAALALRPGQRTDRSDVAEGTDRVDLVFAAAACVGCGRCELLCPADALTSTGRVSWGQLLADGGPVVLEALTTRVCERCRSDFAGDEDSSLCHVCRMRQANPFGSVLPPRYLAPHVYEPPGAGGSSR